MAFDTIQPNNGLVPLKEGGNTTREKLKNELIEEAAIWFAEEEIPEVSIGNGRGIFRGSRVALKKDEMIIEFRKEIEKLDKEILDIFLSNKTLDGRIKAFLKYYNDIILPNKNKSEVIDKKEEISILEVAIVSATAILAEARGDSAEEARKDIMRMIGTDPKVKVEIVHVLNEGNKTLQELGQVLLDYFREKKRREISGVK